MGSVIKLSAEKENIVMCQIMLLRLIIRSRPTLTVYPHQGSLISIAGKMNVWKGNRKQKKTNPIYCEKVS